MEITRYSRIYSEQDVMAKKLCFSAAMVLAADAAAAEDAAITAVITADASLKFQGLPTRAAPRVLCP